MRLEMLLLLSVTRGRAPSFCRDSSPSNIPPIDHPTHLQTFCGCIVSLCLRRILHGEQQQRMNEYDGVRRKPRAIYPKPQTRLSGPSCVSDSPRCDEILRTLFRGFDLQVGIGLAEVRLRAVRTTETTFLILHLSLTRPKMKIHLLTRRS